MHISKSLWILVLCTFGAHAKELPKAWFCVDSQVGGFNHEAGVSPSLTRIQSSKFTLRKKGDGYELIVMGIPATAPDEFRKAHCWLATQEGVEDTAVVCVRGSLISGFLFVMNTSTGVYERAMLGATTQTFFDYKGQSVIAYGTCTNIDD